MDPEEVERVVGGISEKDVMSFARRKLWDQDVAVSAVGSIEGLLDYNRYVYSKLGLCPFQVSPPEPQDTCGGNCESLPGFLVLTSCAESGTI